MSDPIRLNSNLLSLNVLRKLNQHSAGLGSSFQRLSSGLRINKASDDAAGLSISEGLKVDSLIAQRGAKNLNDGISLLSIAEGAVQELQNIANRILELAEQSSNGVLSNAQRAPLNDESNALVREFNRIVNSTSFNQINILNDPELNIGLQAGESTINVALGDALANLVGDGNYIPTSTDSIAAYGAQLAGDVNNDGLEDLIIWGGSGAPNAFSTYLGNGDGSFGSNITYTKISGSVQHAELYDINNDGNLDIIQGSDTEFGYNLGNGDGTFQAPVTTSVIAEDFSLGDFNNDGLMDVFYGEVNSAGSPLYGALYNNGDGTFTNSVLGILTNLKVLPTGDINGDGIDDIVFSNSPTNTYTMFGSSSGLISSIAGTARSSLAVVADFNNDGKDDIIGITGGTSTINYHESNGDGSYQTSVTSTASGTILALETADINEDGYMDLIYRTTSVIGSMLGNGDGTFQAEVSQSIVNASEGGLLVGDFSNDGVLDVITQSSGSGYVRFYEGQTSQVSTIKQFNLSTQRDARESLDEARELTERLSKELANIGASLSRLDFANSVLSSGSLNMEDASSRITDADIAEEVANLTKQSILQNISSALLASANQQNDIGLALLQGGSGRRRF